MVLREEYKQPGGGEEVDEAVQHPQVTGEIAGANAVETARELTGENKARKHRQHTRAGETLRTGFRVIRNLLAVTGLVAGMTMGMDALTGEGQREQSSDPACQKVSEALDIDQVRFAKSRGIAGADIETQTRAWLQGDPDAAAFANLIEAICLPERSQGDG